MSLIPKFKPDDTLMNGLASEAYLRDVLARIADHPINRVGELLPWTVVPSRPIF